MAERPKLDLTKYDFSTPEARVLSFAQILEEDLYIQGSNRLRNQDGTFCCLGVGCDIFAQVNDCEWTKDGPEDNTPWFFGDEQEFFPESVSLWFGLKGQNPDMSNEAVRTVVEDWRYDTGTSMVSLNDDFNFTFKQIAAILRANANATT